MARLLTLHDPGEARAYYEDGLWRRDTLYSLVAQWAQQRGDAPALRDPYRRLSWAELKAEVDSVAATLHAEGLRSGDRVSVWMSNRIEAVVVFLACSRNGYVCCPSLHRDHTVAEIRELLVRMRASETTTRGSRSS